MKAKVDIKDEIQKLPQQPGVYFFRGEKNKILYIGKATNLKSRVQSYFRADVASGRSQWIASMVSQIAKIDFEQTDSVLEALILESNLIKKHQPKYNTQEKDDKSFSYFVITKEEFPRVLIARRTDLDLENLKAKKLKPEKLKAVFGPYTSKQQMQTALKIIRRIFPFHALNQKSEKGCLDFQMGLCPGPYAGAISKAEYAKNIRGIRMILEGKKKRLVGSLEKEMRMTSKREDFEKAATLRNQIFALQHIEDVALMMREFENFEFRISNFESNPNDKISKIKTLEIQSKLKIQNSKSLRIEAYDISNISGQQAVGSMVVFSARGESALGGKNWKPNKSEYRKFKIKTVDGSNDVAMMREVLLRRFGNDWAMPDLVLLDGGIGHANMFSKLADDLGLVVLAVAVAKGKTRKNLNFQFPISNKIPMSKFPKQTQDFLADKNLVKFIMDEAHRFAITFHRKIRRRSALS